jgi:hypothetical protein
VNVMINNVVIPSRMFIEIARRLIGSRGTTYYCPAGVNRLPGETHMLVRSFGTMIQDKSKAIAISMRPQSSVPVATTLRRLSSGLLAAILFDRHNGRMWGYAGHHDNEGQDLNNLLLVGPGMRDVPIEPLAVHQPLSSEECHFDLSKEYLKYSRTISALGLSTWKRLRSLRIAIVGCSRTGASVTSTLAMLGAQHLILIDPDVVETHNLAEVESVGRNDIGKPKVDAVTAYLYSRGQVTDSGATIRAISKGIRESYREAVAADVIFCCVDNDEARLACGILSTLYHKVLIDVGTAILDAPMPHSNRTGAIEMGADVRMLLPGDGCIRCYGSLPDNEDAAAKLAGMYQSNRTQGGMWWMSRRGSLRNLNMVAVGIGIQMLFDLVSGKIEESRWTRIEFDHRGQLVVHHLDRTPTDEKSACSLCPKSGLGDFGLSW